MSQDTSLARVRELLNKMDAAQSIDAEIQIIEALQSAVTPALLRKLVDAYDMRHAPSRGYAALADSMDGMPLLVDAGDTEGGSCD